MQKAKNILVIRMSAMGDVAMTVPVIKTLVAQHPDVKITVVSKDFLKPLFDGIENVTFYTADLHGKHKGFNGIYRLYTELKLFNFDAVADLHDVLRSKLLRTLFKLNNIKVHRIDKGRAEKKALTAFKNKVFKQLTTTHQRYADVFNQLGLAIDLSKPELKTREAIPQEIKTQINHTENEILIGIAPFAAHQGKKYPLELMKQVIDVLSKDYKVLLFGGGQQEVDLLTQISKKIENTYCIAGKVKLKEELCIISNLSIMISMDSGNGHFAAMFGVPTITIWGATHPYAGFAPFNQSENCIVADREKYPLLPTSIYGNKTIPGYENVMETITPQTIINSVSNILK
ncbi:glycosyltransferase family 9 protein [Wenyingzhuangia sp. IMCC45533]